MRREFAVAMALLALGLSQLGVATSAAQETLTADFAIVSNTPSSKHIRTGQTVTFTIVARNNGPDGADFDVDAIYRFGADNLCYREAFITIYPGRSDGFFNGDGPFCEYGVVQPSETVSMFVTSDGLPDPWTVGSKRVSLTVCVHSYEPSFSDPNPENNCATATFRIIGKRR
jgi:Domain of unknown function DUF11